MRWLRKWCGVSNASNRSRKQKRSVLLERLEAREVFAADPLPVLLVVAISKIFTTASMRKRAKRLSPKGLMSWLLRQQPMSPILMQEPVKVQVLGRFNPISL